MPLGLSLERPCGAAAGAVGGVLGGLAHHEVKKRIEHRAFDTIQFGGAGLIVAYPRSSADRVDKAVMRSLKKAGGEADGKKIDALTQALVEAQEQMKRPAQ